MIFSNWFFLLCVTSGRFYKAFWFPPRFLSLMTCKTNGNLTIYKSFKYIFTLPVNMNLPNFEQVSIIYHRSISLYTVFRCKIFKLRITGKPIRVLKRTTRYLIPLYQYPRLWYIRIIADLRHLCEPSSSSSSSRQVYKGGVLVRENLLLITVTVN